MIRDPVSDQLQAEEAMLVRIRAIRRQAWRRRRMAQEDRWRTIAEARSLLGPYLEMMREDLPRSRADYSKEDKVLATQYILMEMAVAAGKPDVAQRALEHVARIRGLVSYRGGAGSRDPEKARMEEEELRENMARVARDLQADLRARDEEPTSRE